MNYWGRIFFRYDDNKKLLAARGQPLENHVENCRLLLEHFTQSHFNPATRKLLFQAASVHDDGKKHTFRIRLADDGKKWGETKKTPVKNAEPPKFSYSFAGHRFHVPGNDDYIDALVRSHHDFNVDRINEERSRFSASSPMRNSFADDLYLLCMADQIEAELAVKTVEKKTGMNPRTFMEFVTKTVSEPERIFTVVPWPFEKESFQISFELLTPESGPPEKPTASDLQKLFVKGSNFKSETIQITLRRN